MFRNVIVTGVLAILLVAVGLAGAQEDAPLPSPDIPMIQTGQAVSGVLDGAVTAKLYAFNATEDDQVTVTLSPAEGATFDPYLVVLGPAGQLMGADDNSGSVERGAQLRVDIPVNGTYFALVTDFAAVDGNQLSEFAEEQPYVISVGGNTYPADVAEQLFYFRSPLEPNSSFEGYSSPLEPVYYFAFEGTAGEVVSLILTSLDIDTLVMLFDTNGNRVAINDDATIAGLPNTTDSAIAEFELPRDGAYLAFATAFNVYELPTAAEVEADDDAAADRYEGGDFTITLER